MSANSYTARFEFANGDFEERSCDDAFLRRYEELVVESVRGGQVIAALWAREAPLPVRLSILGWMHGEVVITRVVFSSPPSLS